MELTLLTVIALLVATIATATSFFYLCLGLFRFFAGIAAVRAGGRATIAALQPIVDGLFVGATAFIAVVSWMAVLP